MTDHCQLVFWIAGNVVYSAKVRVTALIDFISIDAGYLEDKSRATMTWFDVGIGWKRSMATVSQFV